MAEELNEVSAIKNALEAEENGNWELAAKSWYDAESYAPASAKAAQKRYAARAAQAIQRLIEEHHGRNK